MPDDHTLIREALSENERKLALLAFKADDDARRWGNLVLEAYDAVVRERDEAREALRLLRKERDRGLGVVPLLQETIDFLAAAETEGKP